MDVGEIMSFCGFCKILQVRCLRSRSTQAICVFNIVGRWQSGNSVCDASVGPSKQSMNKRKAQRGE